MPLSEHVYCVAIAFKMTEQIEQQICIRFCIKLKHSSMETIQMIQKAFRADAMSAAQIKLWHKCFKDGWESVESDSCSGRSTTSRTAENVEHVRAAINKDWWLTVWEPEADLWGFQNLLGELCEVPRAHFEGHWGIIVLCTMFLVSLINVSIFHSTWLDTLWTGLM